MLAAGAVLIPGARAQTPPSGGAPPGVVRQAGKLVLHQPVERELGPGQADVFTVDVQAGDFIHLVADKEGVDVVVALAGPQGKPLVTADRPNGATGRIPVSAIAGRGGAYQVRVTKSPRSSETGLYRIELAGRHPPTEQDRTRLQAETDFLRALSNDLAHDKEKRSQAIAGYQRAAEFWHSLGDAEAEALCLQRIGRIDYYLGNLQKALEYGNKALALQGTAGGAGAAATLNGLGLVYGELGERQKALDYYNRALPLWRAAADRTGQGMTLNNIGAVYDDLGEEQKALDYYNQALGLRRATGDRSGEAGTLQDIGLVYKHLGEQREALEYYNRALTLERAVGNRRDEARTLNNIGNVYRNLGERRKALEYYNQALPLKHAMGDRASEAATLSNMGVLYSDLAEKRKALDCFGRALPLEHAVGDLQGEAGTLDEMGDLYLDLGDTANARRNYTQALVLARALDNPALQASILSGLMNCSQADNRAELAIFFGKRAINEYQQIRSNIQALEQQLQKSYLATVSKDYRRLADLLIAQGRLAEAEQVLGLLKEQEYFDYVRRDAAEAASVNGHANLNSEEAEADKRYREIADKLVAIGTERGDLLAKPTRTAEEAHRLDRLEKDIAVGNVEFERFLSDLAVRFNAKPMAALRVEDLRETQGIMEDLRELPAGTVAIYTLVGEDKFRAILRTPDVQKAYEYPIKAADLNRKILEFRQVAQYPELDPRPLAEELYKIVVGPMAEDLRQARAQTLMWSLDGALRYLPLAALYDGKRYLIESYRVSVMTLASDTRLKDRPDAEWKAAGFGVTKAYADAPALPWVSAELAGIIASKPGDAGVLAGEVELDGAFTQQAMRETLLKRYPVVHIASHFRFQAGNETQSFLLLGDGAHLSLAELKTSANLFGGVQLLTLSACNTGMGDGTEVEGFGTLAQRQGAKAVIASLWPVADASTSLMMQRFYRIRESSPGKTKLEALREAQLELLRGTTKLAQSGEPVRGVIVKPVNNNEGNPAVQAPRFSVDPQAPYAHPYYWAPFFLMGNWL